MTSHKDFKRVVRARMKKTGESYTAARAVLAARRQGGKAARRQDGRVAATPSVSYAALAGVSDAALKKATYCTWDRWVKALDEVEAHTWPHRDIAQHVATRYKIPGWWSQTVTVGYERIKGLRAKGQRRDGAYEANRSRTFPVPVGRLYRAFSDKRGRARWLDGVEPVVRSSQPGRSVRMTWPDGTSVECWFTARGRDKSQVAVQHRKLAGRADAEARKAYWAERLDALKAVLA